MKSRAFMMFVLAALLGACSGSDNREVIRQTAGSCAGGADDPACAITVFQVLDARDPAADGAEQARVGFIEFNDLGFRHHPEAVDTVFGEIRALDAQDKALLMVVFIHGWHHNASNDDSNVVSFKQFLMDVQHEEDAFSFSSVRRQVVGVYIGWRGESIEGWTSPLTYRSRKNAGLRVGQYGLQEVLAELSKIRSANPKHRLVTVGHSFGGGVLYSAVLQNLVDKVVSAGPAASQGTNLALVGKAYGDLVILMNPALEAARVETVHRRLSNVSFAECQPVVLSSFTSEYDKALSSAFPKGQALFFSDDRKVAQDTGLVTTAYGLHQPYRTHELSCEECEFDVPSGEAYLTRDNFVAAARSWDDFRQDHSQVFPVGELVLNHTASSTLRPGAPIMNVFVRGNNLIADHNEIWGGDFQRFVRALIGMEFAQDSRC